MNYFAARSVIVFGVFGILNAQHALADEEPTQKWSGYVEYMSEHSMSEESDSTWSHATAVKTPTSHKTIGLSTTHSAVFILTRGNPKIDADIRYAQHLTEDVESKAEILCRTPNGRFTTHLTSRYSNRIDYTGGGRAARADVSVGVDKETGEYSVAVGTPDFDGVTATGSTKVTVSSGCDSKPAAPPTNLPPTKISASGISAKGTGKVRVEPGKPIELSGSSRISEYETLTWHLSSDPDDPPIAIHGPYESVRGDAVTFDGSRSKGKNLKYKWTFKAGSCSADATVREVTMEGPVVHAVLLCNTDVALEVSDGERSNKRTRTAKVKPRDWKTELVRVPKRYFDEPIHMLSQDKFTFVFSGANRCGKHDDVKSGTHYLHPDRPWEGVLYELKQVKDGGPFDGMYYVELLQNPLQVPRGIWINSDLKPGSAMAKENTKRKDTARDFNTLMLQAEAHEQMHTTLIEEAMRERDYAKELEAIVGKTRDGQDGVGRYADVKLGEARNMLEEAALNHTELKARLKRDPQFNRSGKVRVHCGADGDKDTYCDWPIPNFAELGDN